MDGAWEKVFSALLSQAGAQADAECDLDWGVVVDFTVVRNGTIARQMPASTPWFEGIPSSGSG